MTVDEGDGRLYRDCMSCGKSFTPLGYTAECSYCSHKSAKVYNKKKHVSKYARTQRVRVVHRTGPGTGRYIRHRDKTGMARVSDVLRSNARSVRVTSKRVRSIQDTVVIPVCVPSTKRKILWQ